MQSQAFKEGLSDGIAGVCDPARQSDRDYLHGVADGMYRYNIFITSTIDHGGIRNSDDPPPEVSLKAVTRYHSPLLRRAIHSDTGHIPLGRPDLSDLEGITRQEDECRAE